MTTVAIKKEDTTDIINNYLDKFRCKMIWNGKRYIVDGENGHPIHIVAKTHEGVIKQFEREEQWQHEYIEHYRKYRQLQLELVFPKWSEEIKNKIYSGINEFGITDSIEDIEEVFDPQSDLYDDDYYFNGYDVETILFNINTSCQHWFGDYSLYNHLVDILEDIYREEMKLLNPYAQDDEDVFNDAISDLMGDYTREWLDKLELQELKTFILKLANK